MEQGAGGAGCSVLVHGGPQGQYACIATPAGPGESREDVCALKCPSRPTMLHMGRIKDHKSSLAARQRPRPTGAGVGAAAGPVLSAGEASSGRWELALRALRDCGRPVRLHVSRPWVGVSTLLSAITSMGSSPPTPSSSFSAAFPPPPTPTPHPSLQPLRSVH